MYRPLLAASLLFVALTGRAAPPTSESVEAVLAASRSEALLEVMYANVEQSMRQGMAQALSGQPLSGQQQRMLESVPRQYAMAMREELSWASLKPLYVKIYQETFSQEEIDGLLAFYSGPVGKTFLDKMPATLQKLNLAMQPRMQPFIARMGAAMEKAITDAKAAR